MTGKVEFPADNSACWRHILEKEGLLQVSVISSSRKQQHMPFMLFMPFILFVHFIIIIHVMFLLAHLYARD